MYKPSALADHENIEEKDIDNGLWRIIGNGLENSQQVQRHTFNYSNNAKEMRDKLVQYFVSEGAVPWQDQKI